MLLTSLPVGSQTRAEQKRRMQNWLNRIVDTTSAGIGSGIDMVATYLLYTDPSFDSALSPSTTFADPPVLRPGPTGSFWDVGTAWNAWAAPIVS